MDLKTREQIRQIAVAFRVHVIFCNLRHAGGEAHMRENLVKICTSQNNTSALQVLFHEIGHIHCYRNQIFPAYHSKVQRQNRAQRLALVRTALRAERWVDAWGEREYRLWFPDGPRWKVSYRSKRHAQYLKDYWRSHLMKRKAA